MSTVRCSICRQQLPTLKLLISHYLRHHSKLKIIQELLKTNILQSTPNLLKYKCKTRSKKIQQNNQRCHRVDSNHVKTETLYLNEDIHILCGQNEIIIGDSKSGVDMEFLFDQNSCESKENYHAPLRDNNGNIIPKKKLKINTNSRDNGGCSRSPSASSEDSTENLCVVKRKIKRKKGLLEKRRHYRINITKLKNQQSLDENSGEFYICHCREKYKSSNALQKSDLRIITSDTESCSDTGKTLLMPTVETKIFCNKCGSGYNNRNELMAHMQIHETFCRLCNESFGCEFTFREHMRLHIFKVYMCHICNKEFPFKELLQMHFEYHMEDRTLETVLDMEEEYRVHRCNFMAKNYNTSINSILCFLSENHDIHYYSYKFMKVVCDICFHEVFFCDYEHHLQSVHYPYTY